jgi:hypothetical protein
MQQQHRTKQHQHSCSCLPLTLQSFARGHTLQLLINPALHQLCWCAAQQQSRRAAANLMSKPLPLLHCFSLILLLLQLILLLLLLLSMSVCLSLSVCLLLVCLCVSPLSCLDSVIDVIPAAALTVKPTTCQLDAVHRPWCAYCIMVQSHLVATTLGEVRVRHLVHSANLLALQIKHTQTAAAAWGCLHAVKCELAGVSTSAPALRRPCIPSWPKPCAAAAHLDPHRPEGD